MLGRDFNVTHKWGNCGQRPQGSLVHVLVYVGEPSVPFCVLMLSSFQSWDTELEAFAQAYAEKCIWDHNKERGRRGENLFAMAPTLDLEFAVEDWNAEEKYYNLTTSTCVPGQMCGHYTQVPCCWAGRMQTELYQSSSSS